MNQCEPVLIGRCVVFIGSATTHTVLTDAMANIDTTGSHNAGPAVDGTRNESIVEQNSKRNQQVFDRQIDST